MRHHAAPSENSIPTGYTSVPLTDGVDLFVRNDMVDDRDVHNAIAELRAIASENAAKQRQAIPVIRDEEVG